MILCVGIGLKGVAFVLDETNEEIEAYLEGDDEGDDEERRRQLSGLSGLDRLNGLDGFNGLNDFNGLNGLTGQALRPRGNAYGRGRRRLETELWDAEEYEDHMNAYLNMVCWAIFFHLLFGTILHCTRDGSSPIHAAVPKVRLWIGRILPTWLSIVLFVIPDAHMRELSEHPVYEYMEENDDETSIEDDEVREELEEEVDKWAESGMSIPEFKILLALVVILLVLISGLVLPWRPMTEEEEEQYEGRHLPGARSESQSESVGPTPPGAKSEGIAPDPDHHHHVTAIQQRQERRQKMMEDMAQRHDEAGLELHKSSS